MIYLDNNASTKLDAQVVAAMAETASSFGNPSSLHAEGRKARRAIEEARDEVARLVRSDPEEIFFTSGGTEANALAIFGSLAGRSGRVVSTTAEHPSVREPILRAGRQAGREAVLVSPEASGTLDPDRFMAQVEPGTALVSVMAANNEYGGLYPVAQLAEQARRRGAVFHTDAVQAAGRVAVDLRAWNVDLASFSAHKLHGPKGVGALFVRRGVNLEAHTPGGGQEKKLRAGTENTIGIVGFGVAARLAFERGQSESARIVGLRDGFERAVVSRIEGARVVGGQAPRLPNTSAILFEGVPGDTLVIRLDLEGIAASVGSACSSGTAAPSPAILALGFSPTQAMSVVRFSLSRLTTAAEMDLVADRLAEMVVEIRRAAAGPVKARAEVALR